MRFQSLGDKPEGVFLHVRAAEAIALGQPVCLEFDATDDGLSVALASTAAANHAHAYFFGIATQAIASGKIGEVQIFGFNRNTMYVGSRTRSDTNVNWPTMTSVAANALLAVNTVNNAMESTGGTQAVSGFLPYCVCVDSIASFGTLTSGTTTGATISYVTSLVKTFLRAM